MKSIWRVLARQPIISFIVLVSSLGLQLYVWTRFMPESWSSILLLGVIVCSFSAMLVAGWFPPERWGYCFSIVNDSVHRYGRLQRMFTELSQRLRIVPPSLGIAHTSTVAFAVGVRAKRSLVVIDQDFIEALSDNELEAILAHELSHIQLGHTWQLTLLQAALLPIVGPLAVLLGLATALLCAQPQRYLEFAYRCGSWLPYCVCPLTGVLVLALQHRWEYAADRRAAHLIGKDKLLATLRCLHGVFPDLHPNYRAVFDPRRIWRQVTRLTHPPITRRIGALWRN